MKTTDIAAAQAQILRVTSLKPPYLASECDDKSPKMGPFGSGLNIERHNKPDPEKTYKSKDARDRFQAEVVDTYNASDTAQGRQREKRQIDSNGGVSNLDNKRNEIKPTP